MFYLKKCLNPFIFKINYLIFSLIILQIITSECPENTPILKNNNCELTYCSEFEFNNNYCSINNTKMKTQWLTNIIIFGDNKARFINFATFSNGDFIVEATPCEVIIAIRFFFGLKQNGRNLFKINTTETQFYSFKPINEENYGKKYQGEIQIVKMNQENNKEYLLSLTKAQSYAELYDFENGIMYKKKMIVLFWYENQNERQISLTISNNTYSIYGYIESNNPVIKIFKFSFNNKNEIESSSQIQPIKIIEGEYGGNGNSISCFETKNNRIVCFYYNREQKPYIYIMDNNFNLIQVHTIINQGYYRDSSFIKCIHLYDEFGIFSFYDKINANSDEIYPFVYFKKIKDNGVLENAISNYNEYIILNYTFFENNTLMNDITKISNTKICYTATSKDHETIYIIVFHIINMEKIVIRYYSFPIFKLRNYKILSDMKSYSYNQFVTIGASVCNQSQCYNDHGDYHYSSLIIFSYPNSTDENFVISDELLKDKENIEIDLKTYVKIENNIFGYIFYGIQMNNIICSNNNRKLYSTKKNLNIVSNYTL